MIRPCLGAALLLLQLALVVRAQTVATDRYFAWAPLHEQAKLRIEVQVGGARLDPAEVAHRYGLRAMFYDRVRGEHWELNRAEHVLATIAAVEGERGEGARVRVTLRRNGGEETEWRWPPR